MDKTALLKGERLTKIETALDMDKRTAIVSIHTDTKIFRMRYDIDQVVAQLEGMTSNWFAKKTLELLGFHVDVETKPPEQPAPPA
jgi:hypothetical protein